MKLARAIPKVQTSVPPMDAISRAANGVRLRGLFVLNSLSVGGSETKTVRVANGLLQQDVTTGIATLNEPGALLSSVDPEIPIWHLQRRGKLSWAALKSLRSLIHEQQPSVVLAVSLYPALYVSLAVMGMRNRPRILALINTTDLRRGREWEPSFYRHFLRRFDTTIYGCELQRSRWLSLLRTQYDRSAVIYNGVDTEHFIPPASAGQRLETRKQFGIRPQAFVLGAIGRLAPEKNQLVLIDAIAELRRRSVDAHLLLVGEGRMRASLERRVAEQRMQPYVTFAGMQSDVRPALSTMDVFALPSTHVETFSNAALEAMAMCKPVILSRIGGAAEMVNEGIEGYTLECSTLRDRLPPLLEQLSADRQLRERLGRAGRERVAHDFSLQAMVARYAALLDGNSTGALRPGGRS